MDVITLRFSAGKTIVAKLARWFSWSEYNHVDYVFDNGMCYGAQNYGVGLNRDEPKKYVYYQMEVNNKLAIEDFLLKQSGKPYDWYAVIGMPFRKDWQDDSKWFCSELVAAAIQTDTPIINERMSRVTPRDLMILPALKRVDFKA